MHVQLLGDGADQPLLRVVEAQYPRFNVRWSHHGRVPSGRVVAPAGDRRGDARTLDGRDPGSAARTNHSAIKAAGLGPRRPMRRSRSPASRRTANHPVATVVNRDASHFCTGPGNGESLCMGKPSPAAGLVAPARVKPGAPAGTRGAVAGAIDLAAVATTTDQRLSVAFRTHEQPGRRRGAVTGSADIPWTSAMIAGILTPHACPARCRARRRT